VTIGYKQSYLAEKEKCYLWLLYILDRYTLVALANVNINIAQIFDQFTHWDISGAEIKQ